MSPIPRYTNAGKINVKCTVHSKTKAYLFASLQFTFLPLQIPGRPTCPTRSLKNLPTQRFKSRRSRAYGYAPYVVKLPAIQLI